MWGSQPSSTFDYSASECVIALWLVKMMGTRAMKSGALSCFMGFKKYTHNSVVRVTYSGIPFDVYVCI